MHMLIYLAYALLLLHVFLGALQSERSAPIPSVRPTAANWSFTAARQFFVSAPGA